jgi:hypothetical protein
VRKKWFPPRPAARKKRNMSTITIPPQIQITPTLSIPDLSEMKGDPLADKIQRSYDESVARYAKLTEEERLERICERVRRHKLLRSHSDAQVNEQLAATAKVNSPFLGNSVVIYSDGINRSRLKSSQRCWMRRVGRKHLPTNGRSARKTARRTRQPAIRSLVGKGSRRRQRVNCPRVVETPFQRKKPIMILSKGYFIVLLSLKFGIFP